MDADNNILVVCSSVAGTYLVRLFRSLELICLHGQLDRYTNSQKRYGLEPRIRERKIELGANHSRLGQARSQILPCTGNTIPYLCFPVTYYHPLTGSENYSLEDCAGRYLILEPLGDPELVIRRDGPSSLIAEGFKSDLENRIAALGCDHYVTGSSSPQCHSDPGYRYAFDFIPAQFYKKISLGDFSQILVQIRQLEWWERRKDEDNRFMYRDKEDFQARMRWLRYWNS